MSIAPTTSSNIYSVTMKITIKFLSSGTQRNCSLFQKEIKCYQESKYYSNAMSCRIFYNDVCQRLQSFAELTNESVKLFLAASYQKGFLLFNKKRHDDTSSDQIATDFATSASAAADELVAYKIIVCLFCAMENFLFVSCLTPSHQSRVGSSFSFFLMSLVDIQTVKHRRVAGRPCH